MAIDPQDPTCLAGVWFFDAVKSRLEADGSDVVCTFGWRSPTEQNHYSEKRRLMWSPGDDKGTPGNRLADLGRLSAPKTIGELPRSLATLDELFTVYCWAADVAFKDSGTRQYSEARFLFDAFFRALRLTGRRFDVVKAEWYTTAKESRHGAAVRVVVSLSASVHDEPLGTVHPHVLTNAETADLTVTQNDHTESLIVSV